MQSHKSSNCHTFLKQWRIYPKFQTYIQYTYIHIYNINNIILIIFWQLFQIYRVAQLRTSRMLTNCLNGPNGRLIIHFQFFLSNFSRFQLLVPLTPLLFFVPLNVFVFSMHILYFYIIFQGPVDETFPAEGLVFAFLTKNLVFSSLLTARNYWGVTSFRGWLPAIFLRMKFLEISQLVLTLINSGKKFRHSAKINWLPSVIRTVNFLKNENSSQGTSSSWKINKIIKKNWS